MLQLASLAVALMERPAILHRHQSDVWLDGRHIRGEATQTTIRAVLRPPNEAVIRNLAEGERSEGVVVIWSRTQLRASSEVSQERADEVEQGGARYRVQSVDTRSEGGFWRAIARKVGPS